MAMTTMDYARKAGLRLPATTLHEKELWLNRRNYYIRETGGVFCLTDNLLKQDVCRSHDREELVEFGVAQVHDANPVNW